MHVSIRASLRLYIYWFVCVYVCVYVCMLSRLSRNYADKKLEMEVRDSWNDLEVHIASPLEKNDSFDISFFQQHLSHFRPYFLVSVIIQSI